MPTWSQIRDAIISFLPRPLGDAIQKGLLPALLLVFTAIAAVPLLIVLLAALWLKVLSSIDVPGITALRNSYLQVVNEGFSIEQVAARSNARLDYLQLFEYELKPKRTLKELRLSLRPMQKAAITMQSISFVADDPSCTLPENDIDLVSVSLGDQVLKTFRSESNVHVMIGENWWREHQKNFDDDDAVQRLTFKLTDQARQLKCGQVRIEGNVEVFKDLFTSTVGRNQ